MKYSQCGQDVFVLSMLDNNRNGTFVDVGCRLPFEINNTCLLEEHGWHGVSLDIVNFTQEWRGRRTPFVCRDALTCDYQSLFESYNLPQTIDYLSIDLERVGARYAALKKVFESGYEFKIVTIEHDVYMGFDEAERKPQRAFLKSKGYVLVCSDVSTQNNIPFEDWWINPKYIAAAQYRKYLSDRVNFLRIFKKAGINRNDYYHTKPPRGA